jgi:hypothetical protein
MADKPYRWAIRRFRTPRHLIEYLNTLARPGWLRGLTVHHTVLPLPEDWRGAISMRGIGNYYRDDLGWDSGPQLFIAPDGIWQGTPVNQTGIHAGICNATHIGMEVVGNYDRTPWPEPMRTLALETIAAVMRWGGVPLQRVVGHRDCLPNKSCPGNMIKLADVRTKVAEQMAYPAKWHETLNTDSMLRVRSGPSTKHAVLAELPTKSLVPVRKFVKGEVINGNPYWGLRSSGYGYVSAAWLQEL